MQPVSTDEKNRILKAETPYATLLLPTSATPEEAKYQYFKLVKRYSPEFEEEAFRKIRRAYEELKDPVKKAATDVMLFTARPGRVKFSGVNTLTTSQVKLNREIKAISEASTDGPETEKRLVNAYKHRAVLLARNKKWNESLADIDRIEKVEGLTEEIKENRIFILSHLALDLAEKGQYAEAGLRWRRALQLDPDRSDLLHNLAVCATLLLNREDENIYWVETFRAWHRELSQKGDDPYLKSLILESHKRFGGRYLHQTGDEGLRDEVSRLISSEGIVLHAMGPNSGAVPGGKQSRESAPVPSKRISTAAPGTPEADGLDAFSRQNWAVAIENFKKHLEEHPDDGSIMDKLGWSLMHAKHGNEAFALWRRMLKDGPDKETGKESYIRAKLDTARKLRRQMMTNPAMVQLKDVLKYIPDSKEVLVELAGIYKDRGDNANALQYYQKAIEVDPTDRSLSNIVRELKMKTRVVGAMG